MEKIILGSYTKKDSKGIYSVEFDTEKKEKYKVYGELLHTYGYEAKPNDKSITVLNYYTNEELTIPLDPDFSASENAKRYFD